MAMNILAHINASTQGNLSPPSVIPKHFVRILLKYASFSRLYYALSWLHRDMKGCFTFVRSNA